MVPDARCGLRGEQVAAGGLEEFQHRLVFKRGRIGEVDHQLRAGHGLLEPLAGDAVDTAFGRGGDDFVAALAQNGDGLRADQAGAADDDDLHGLLSPCRRLETLKWVRMQVRKISGPQRACIMQTREETNTEASLLNTPLAVSLTTLSTLNATLTRNTTVFVPPATVTGG